MTDGHKPGLPDTPPDAAAASARAPTLTAATIDLPRRPSSPGANDAGPPAPAAATDPRLGTLADGRYRFERVLGEGGMGVVYAGRHAVIEKRVAIKVLRRDLANDQELNERFLQEARAASAIGNPHIVDISDFGSLPDGSTFFVMELLEGTSLTDALSHAKGPLPLLRLCRIARQIAEGLAAAHDANIVHRDLKPDNVMLVRRGGEDDFVKILDFGIAKVGAGTKRMTRAGSVFGTPHYMSPEQASGAAVDPRTDIYALGVILYEMASGNVPFDADNFMGILTQHIYRAPVPIRTLLPDLDVTPGLDAVILKCLAKKPEDRYASMRDLIADLDRLQLGVTPAAAERVGPNGHHDAPAADSQSNRGPVAAVTGPHSSTRRPSPVAWSAALVLALAGVLGGAFLARAPSRPAPPPSVPTTSVAATPSATPSVTLAPPPPAVETSVLATSEVLVSVAPGGAKIARDGVDLGDSPVALHLADGEQATLVLSCKGYKTKTVRVGATQPKQAFTLEPIVTAPALRAPASSPPPAMGGIDDVGDPFAAKH